MAARSPCSFYNKDFALDNVIKRLANARPNLAAILEKVRAENERAGDITPATMDELLTELNSADYAPAPMGATERSEVLDNLLDNVQRSGERQREAREKRRDAEQNIAGTYLEIQRAIASMNQKIEAACNSPEKAGLVRRDVELESVSSKFQAAMTKCRATIKDEDKAACYKSLDVAKVTLRMAQARLDAAIKAHCEGGDGPVPGLEGARAVANLPADAQQMRQSLSEMTMSGLRSLRAMYDSVPELWMITMMTAYALRAIELSAAPGSARVILAVVPDVVREALRSLYDTPLFIGVMAAIVFVISALMSAPGTRTDKTLRGFMVLLATLAGMSLFYEPYAAEYKLQTPGAKALQNRNPDIVHMAEVFLGNEILPSELFRRDLARWAPGLTAEQRVRIEDMSSPVFPDIMRMLSPDPRAANSTQVALRPESGLTTLRSDLTEGESSTAVPMVINEAYMSFAQALAAIPDKSWMAIRDVSIWGHCKYGVNDLPGCQPTDELASREIRGLWHSATQAGFNKKEWERVYAEWSYFGATPNWIRQNLPVNLFSVESRVDAEYRMFIKTKDSAAALYDRLTAIANEQARLPDSNPREKVRKERIDQALADLGAAFRVGFRNVLNRLVSEDYQAVMN